MTMKTLLTRLVLPLLLAVGASSAWAQDAIKVVYHLNEGVQQASRAIGNIRNHL
ncbi:MAG: hypothetical protein HXY24_10115, partial [Rubrivivax sp.]|nr:hypothetical protein [Rubrivivax sp.]